MIYLSFYSGLQLSHQFTQSFGSPYFAPYSIHLTSQNKLKFFGYDTVGHLVSAIINEHLLETPERIEFAKGIKSILRHSKSNKATSLQIKLLYNSLFGE